MQSMWGHVCFLAGTPSGIRSTVPYVTATEKYTVGLPGQETGLRLADGVQYGDVVMMINKQNEYLQADHNGWIYYRAKADGNWDHFTMLSPIHREGKVSYGDQIVMRAHNGRMVSSRTGGNLEAVSMVPTDDSVFTILGIEGASTGSTLCCLPSLPLSHIVLVGLERGPCHAFFFAWQSSTIATRSCSATSRASSMPLAMVPVCQWGQPVTWRTWLS